MAQVVQLTGMGLNQVLASQFSQSNHSKCLIDQWMDLHEGGRVLQKEIP